MPALTSGSGDENAMQQASPRIAEAPAHPRNQEQSSFKVAHETEKGVMYEGLAETVLRSDLGLAYRGRCQLILTSPPFPLNRKKAYGNKQGDEYIEWLSGFARLFRSLLKKDGSLVMEMGNAWEPGEPAMSTLALRAMLAFLDAGDFTLCQQFICYNPARLPAPAQWVNIERIRVKDSYTHLWWMAKHPKPLADNRRVLKPYSDSMKKLLRTQKYNSGRRPSEHDIGTTSFLTKHEGAIPPNVLTFTNTTSVDPYLAYCREEKIDPHPARMPSGLAEFFIRFLTVRRNLVLDPFAGSNVTGAAAEKLGRRWVAIEPKQDYIRGSIGRFTSNDR